MLSLIWTEFAFISCTRVLITFQALTLLAMELSSNKHSTIVVYRTFNAISKIWVDFVKTRENILSNIWFAVVTSTLFLFSLFNGFVYTKFNLKLPLRKMMWDCKGMERVAQIFLPISCRCIDASCSGTRNMFMTFVLATNLEHMKYKQRHSMECVCILRC